MLYLIVNSEMFVKHQSLALVLPVFEVNVFVISTIFFDAEMGPIPLHSSIF